jgi:predicted MFS family arabinose efflux permease
MMALLGNGSFMAISASRGLLTMGRVVVITFLPVYLVTELGFKADALGVYLFLLHVVGIFSQTPLGYMSDRYGRKPVLVPSMVVLGVLYMLLAVVPSVAALTIVIIAIGTFFYTLMNVMTAVISDVAGANVQASSQGLTTVIAQVAVLPTPIIAGYLVDHYGYGSAFVMAGVCVILSAACLMPLRLYAGDRQPSVT